jgi:hypothetical protein
MPILLISIVWLGAIAVLVLLLARRPERSKASPERSPRLLPDQNASFEQTMEAIWASEPATAKDVRDSTQHDLYVRP